MLSHFVWPEASKLPRTQCRGQEARPVEAEGQGSSGKGGVAWAARPREGPH